MKFTTMNANDIIHLMSFPDTIDVRFPTIICEVSEDSKWFINVFVDKTEKYALRVFQVGDDKVAILKNETDGFTTYLEGRAIGRAIVRYWDTVKGDPSASKPLTMDGLTEYMLPEDFHAAGMGLFIERGSKQIISVFMVGAGGKYERFPFTVDNVTFPMPVHLAIAIREVNKKIEQKSGSYARIKRPLKTGDLIYADSLIPAYATVWILDKTDSKELVPCPLDPTFDINKWLEVPVEEHRKGCTHCFQAGLYRHTGLFNGMFK